MVDVSNPLHDTDELDDEVKPGSRTQIAVNRNLVREVDIGSIVLVPRPSEGLVYAGYTRKFELVDQPSWGDAYIALRKTLLTKKDSKLNRRGSHLADVVQGWPVARHSTATRVAIEE